MSYYVFLQFLQATSWSIIISKWNLSMTVLLDMSWDEISCQCFEISLESQLTINAILLPILFVSVSPFQHWKYLSIPVHCQQFRCFCSTRLYFWQVFPCVWFSVCNWSRMQLQTLLLISPCFPILPHCCVPSAGFLWLMSTQIYHRRSNPILPHIPFKALVHHLSRYKVDMHQDSRLFWHPCILWGESNLIYLI